MLLCSWSSYRCMWLTYILFLSHEMIRHMATLWTRSSPKTLGSALTHCMLGLIPAFCYLPSQLNCSGMASKFKIYPSKSWFPTSKVGMIASLQGFYKGKYNQASRKPAPTKAVGRDSLKTSICHFQECLWQEPLAFDYLGKGQLIPQEENS